MIKLKHDFHLLFYKKKWRREWNAFMSTLIVLNGNPMSANCLQYSSYDEVIDLASWPFQPNYEHSLHCCTSATIYFSQYTIKKSHCTFYYLCTVYMCLLCVNCINFILWAFTSESICTTQVPWNCPSWTNYQLSLHISSV